jgi:hypothetical protein
VLRVRSSGKVTLHLLVVRKPKLAALALVLLLLLLRPPLLGLIKCHGAPGLDAVAGIVELRFFRLWLLLCRLRFLLFLCW